MSSRPGVRHLIAAAALALTATASVIVSLPAAAHGFSTVVHVDASAQADDTVRTELGLEYDLLVVSVADFENAPQFFEDGMDVFQTGDEASALNAHAGAIMRYVTERFEVSADGQPCEPDRVGEIGVTQREGVPYAMLTLDHACGHGSVHEIRSELFPDAEEYVTGTVTVLEYDLDGQSGSAALDREAPVFTTEQPLLERFGHFFVLGAEHLLFGIDHVLFLLALIVGSRRLRDVVLAATSFTVAHSVTFILAALGIVSAPGVVVEPIIALSIAVVAAWYLWRLWRGPRTLAPESPGRFGLDRADWARLAVVFGFGLVHGLGFAGALGIDEPFSWPLLWSLLVFNVGIEAVQIAVIAAVFPLLVLLRRREPKLALGVGAAVAAGVAVTGLVWFVQRLVGAG
ncbi:HupE/UreJ family protein [Agromyces albus]|uniref:HupE/UreJ family protein n=1 Tax=Agromyces albus TaxID=205332 RepID=A0A4Q2L604_9MICO|nr:HupE/UreJ family protein [Agromyces albus]RXZ71842.1 HupE/UreJ family protein [Agromyces albus]